MQVEIVERSGYRHIKKEVKSRIVLVSETLVTGGAETLVLRLASALHARGERVTLYVLRADKVDAVLAHSIAPGVPMVLGSIRCLKVILKLDGLLFRFGLGCGLLRWLQARRLRAYLACSRPDVVHAHLFNSDLVTARATESLGIPWVTTMHGDYEAFEKQGHNRAARIRDFGCALSEVESSVGHMVCITDRQVEQLGRLLPSLASRGCISKIYNGYAAAGPASGAEVPEALARIPKDAFVIGMVARGIRDKGWEVLIAAFRELKLPNSWLVLVGDGEYLQKVRPGLQGQPIVFVGNVVDPLRYIARFDVGCLPSRIKSESLPTVVIEYLYLGKPVIASNVGELSAMLGMESDAPAGLLIELDSVEEMVKQMKGALQRIHDDSGLRQFLQTNALNAVRKFDMNKCVDEYFAVYEAVQK